MAIRLVAFDLDGTLVRGETCVQAIGRAIGRDYECTAFEQVAMRDRGDVTAAPRADGRVVRRSRGARALLAAWKPPAGPRRGGRLRALAETPARDGGRVDDVALRRRLVRRSTRRGLRGRHASGGRRLDSALLAGGQRRLARPAARAPRPCPR